MSDVTKLVEKLKEFGISDELATRVEFMEKYKSDRDIAKATALVTKGAIATAEVWRGAGLLNLEAVTFDEESTSLVFGFAKYMHWFRGYYFQVSGTPNGRGSVITPGCRMDYIMNAIADFPEDLRIEASAFVLAMSALTTAYVYFKPTTVAVVSESEELDRFLKASGEHTWCRDNVCIDSVMRYVTTSQSLEMFDVDTGAAVLVTEDNHGYAVLSYADNALHLQVKRRGEDLPRYHEYVLTFPAWMNMMDPKDEDFALLNDWSCLVQAFVEFLLHRANICANYVVMYPRHTAGRALMPDMYYNTRNRFYEFGDLLDYMVTYVKSARE